MHVQLTCENHLNIELEPVRILSFVYTLSSDSLSELVLKAALSLYMEDKDLPMPTPEEMLICNQHTTAEEVSCLFTPAHNTNCSWPTSTISIYNAYELYFPFLPHSEGEPAVAESCVRRAGLP